MSWIAISFQTSHLGRVSFAGGRNHCDLPFDVHLMVENPMQYLPMLTDIGVELVSIQIETTHFAPRILSIIRELGFKPSIALNPQTSLANVEEILHLVDNVLIMSSGPGVRWAAIHQFHFCQTGKIGGIQGSREPGLHHTGGWRGKP